MPTSAGHVISAIGNLITSICDAAQNHIKKGSNDAGEHQHQKPDGRLGRQSIEISHWIRSLNGGNFNVVLLALE